MQMTSSRPYLLRALYEWIVDNGMTPLIVVHADMPGVFVPQAYVQDGSITLNVSPAACSGMEMNNHALSFSARFGGVPNDVFVPISAIAGIYTRETGEGMGFEGAPGDPGDGPPGPGDGPAEGPYGDSTGKTATTRPALRVVK